MMDTFFGLLVERECIRCIRGQRDVHDDLFRVSQVTLIFGTHNLILFERREASFRWYP
jgi:hypothetical protein